MHCRRLACGYVRLARRGKLIRNTMASREAMTNLSFFEYEKKPFSEFRGLPGMLPQAVLCDRIARLNEEENVELIKVGRRYLQATQYVGILRLDEVTIQVLPKIHYSIQADPEKRTEYNPKQVQIETATRNFLFLLSYFYDLKLRGKELDALSRRRSEWFELLTRFFAQSLHTEIQHGLDRKYVYLEDTLPVLRGRWLIGKQLARHPTRKWRFDVQYDEFLSDTPMNRIFRYVAEQLLVRSNDPANRRMLADIRHWLSGVGRIIMPERAHLDRVIFTRLNDRFRPPFNLARLFIEHGVFQLSAGRHELFAFMFDMDRLFEGFIGSFLTRHRKEIFSGTAEDVRVRLQSAGITRHLGKRIPDQDAVHRLRPDILLEDDEGDVLLVADTKYKHLHPESRDLGVNIGDMYQMHAYGRAWRCPNELLIYPSQSPEDSTFGMFDVLDHTGCLAVGTINLHRPLEKKDALIGDFRRIFKSAIFPQEAYIHGAP
jgi:5-methylcytosine-specific restriction enzyme subunit McrC